MTPPLLGALLFGLVALPPLAPLLEATLPSHLLGQLPALAIAGALAVGAVPRRLRARLDRINDNGVPGMALAAILLAYWMLPRTLDAALATADAEVAKLLCLPLAGAAARLGWRNLGFVGRSFVLLNAVSMLLAIGLLLIHSPLRLCNAYLLDDQRVAGTGLAILAGVLACVGAGGLLFRFPWDQRTEESSCAARNPLPSPPPSSA
ncbi:MAG: hypothetical protein ACM31D_19105 [Bacteroidota bacterium]